MKRLGVFLFIPLIYISGLLIYFANYIKQDIIEFEKLKLSYAVDFSSDAAIQNLLASLDLEMDYANKGYINADPKMALDAFVDVFLFNYGAGIDNINRDHVKMNFIPVFAVAMFDGYYIGTQRLIKNANDYPEGGIRDGDWGLQFSPKLPYTYVNGGASYALNMGGDYTFKLSGNVLTKEFGLPPGIASKADVRREITKIVSADISYHIDKINEVNPDWANTFYLPGDVTTLSNVNPLEGPSVLAIVQNVDFATSKKIGAFSVGGSKIQTARMIAGYTRAGRKYYCYADKMPSAVTAESIYTTMEEAAKDGYSFDVEYMQ